MINSSIPFYDKTKAVVYERAAYTSSGYHESIAIFRTKKEAGEYIKDVLGGHQRGRYLVCWSSDVKNIYRPEGDIVYVREDSAKERSK